MSKTIEVAGIRYYVTSEKVRSGHLWDAIGSVKGWRVAFRLNPRDPSKGCAYICVEAVDNSLYFYTLNASGRSWSCLDNPIGTISGLITDSLHFDVLSPEAPVSSYSPGDIIPASDISRMHDGSILRCHLEKDQYEPDRTSFWVVVGGRILQSSDTAKATDGEDRSIKAFHHPRETWYVVYNPEAV